MKPYSFDVVLYEDDIKRLTHGNYIKSPYNRLMHAEISNINISNATTSIAEEYYIRAYTQAHNASTPSLSSEDVDLILAASPLLTPIEALVQVLEAKGVRNKLDLF